MALTVMEVAKDLNISKFLVYKEIQEGRLSAFRVGKQQLRIKESELEAYKNRNKVEYMEEL